MSKRAALYLRQSKADDQGIDRQMERTRALADLRKWTVVGDYVDDGLSASKVRGAGSAWERMLKDADAGLIDVVVGVDLDRLLRSTRDLNTLIDHGLAVVTVDGEIDLSTADGEFRASMMASIARFEVRRKGERQTRANVQRATRGGVPKGVRLTGYSTTGAVVPDEADRVRTLFEGFAAGETLRGLSRDHDLTPSTVRGILMNPRYCGRRAYLGEIVGVGDWEPIVSEGLFDVVNRRLADPARAKNRTGSTARKHLGTSLFRCGMCADNPTVRTAGGSGRYWCKSCGLVRRMTPVDDYVLSVLYDRLTRPEIRQGLSPVPDVDPLRERAEALRGRKSDLASLVGDGTLSAADVKIAAGKIDAELLELDRQIARVYAPVPTLTEGEISEGIEHLTLDRRRALIDMTMTVTLLRGKRGSKAFDPETVVIDWRSTEPAIAAA